MLVFVNGNHGNELLSVCERIQSDLKSDDTRIKFDEINPCMKGD